MEANIILHEIRSFLSRLDIQYYQDPKSLRLMWKLMKFQKKKQRKKIQKPEIKTKNPWKILVWKPSLVQLKGTPSLICIPIWQILISLVSYRCISILIAYHRPDKSTWQLQLCSTEYKKLLNLPPEIIVIMYYNWQLVSFLLFSFRNM